jgi:hypothetical protein
LQFCKATEYPQIAKWQKYATRNFMACVRAPVKTGNRKFSKIFKLKLIEHQNQVLTLSFLGTG